VEQSSKKNFAFFFVEESNKKNGETTSLADIAVD
jgi:hypothetical protein